MKSKFPYHYVCGECLMLGIREVEDVRLSISKCSNPLTTEPQECERCGKKIEFYARSL